MNWEVPERIHFRSSLPVWTFLAGLAGIGSAWGAASGRPEFLPVAVAAGVLFGLGLITRRPACILRFHPDGIEDVRSGRRVLFGEITGLYLSNHCLINSKTAREARSFFIAYGNGCLRLPRSTSLDRVELYRYLLPRTRLMNRSERLPGRLAEVAAAEEQDFPGMVIASRGRPFSKGEWPSARGWWIAAGAFVAGYITSVDIKLDRDIQVVWLAIGATLAVLAVLMTLAVAAGRSARAKLRAGAGVVVSPRGMTLESPLLKGTLQWSEVRNVRLFETRFSPRRGIFVEVEGGRIFIMDDYDCPLTELHAAMTRYLRHE